MYYNYKRTCTSESKRVSENKSKTQQNQTIGGIRLRRRIRINRKQVIEECRVDTNNILDLVGHLQLKGVHRRILKWTCVD